LEDVEEAAGGDTHCLALKKDGSLWGWGSNNAGQLGISESSAYVPKKIPKFWESSESIVGIGCGAYFSWAIADSGNIFLWGDGNGMIIEEDGREVPTKKDFRVVLPHALIQAQWGTIFRWIFLGVSDFGSGFRNLPVEVTFHMVSVWRKQ
jgi:hypothetical protein